MKEESKTGNLASSRSGNRRLTHFWQANMYYQRPTMHSIKDLLKDFRFWAQIWICTCFQIRSEKIFQNLKPRSFFIFGKVNSQIYSLIYSLIYPLIYTSVHPISYFFVCPLIYPPLHPFIYPLIYPFIYSFVCPISYFFVCLINDLIIYPLI